VAGFVFSNNMETFIAILLVAIAVLLYEILGRLKHADDSLHRIKMGLFPTPNGGLDKLVYLELIEAKLKELVDAIKK